MLLNLLLSLNVLVCLALIGVVLLQRSEGGALGGGSPSSMITTRGAGDLLTRTTWILFTLFLGLSLALTIIGGHDRSPQASMNRLKSLSVNPDVAAAQAAAAAKASDKSQSRLPPLTGPETPATPGSGPGTIGARPGLSLPPVTSSAPTPAAPSRTPAK